MPKPMLKPNNQTKTETDSALSLSPTSKAKETSPEMKMKTDRLLRKPRSKRYMEMIHQLDVGGHTNNQKQTEAIIDAIRTEFPEVEINGILLGIISKCYLGDDYEVHTVDATNSIIEHFRTGQSVNGGMEKARSIAMRGGYDFIEVYVDCCRAISSNGSVSVIK